MIQQGHKWQARDMADAAKQVADESTSPPERVYALTVEHVLRVIVGDAKASPQLQVILDRYSDNIG